MTIRKRANGTLSTGEVGQLLGVERRTVGVWVKNGKLKASRTLGDAIRVDIKDAIGLALDGGVKISRSAIPYSDDELVAMGVPKAQVSALK